MQLSWKEIQEKAIKFSRRWKNACREKADSQPFVTEFLGVFGVDDPVKAGEREKAVKISGAHEKYIDFFWKSQVAIEMKSLGKDLDDAYLQLKDYMEHIPAVDVPDLWMVCDFENIRLYRRSTNEIWNFETKDLYKHIKRFANIAGYDAERTRDEQRELNIKAAEKMADLHDALQTHGYDGHDLEVYLVRLLFCLFAGDTGIFPKGNFYYYIKDSKEDGSDLSHRISDLFEVLNMSDEVRKKKALLSDELKQFRYINGALFAGRLPPADFNAKMRKILLECREFDWSQISPAIFGAMFQGVMDKKKRREIGAHYTSEENNLKLINPLVMDSLKEEFEKVKNTPKKLGEFHDKIASLKFLDPACGCGNFLIVAYRELRRLELEVLKIKKETDKRIHPSFNISWELLRVNVGQFFGIECDDFACQIAQVGMWLIDHQMNLEASVDLLEEYHDNLPLTKSATIAHGNALRMDWEDVVPKEKLSYILGNPPFVGYSNQSEEQKKDILSVYLGTNGKPFKTAGKIDYVAAWYYKAAKLLSGTQIRAAFVSTNSITQGEQVSAVWKPLFEMFGISINFAYRTFKWSNEAKGKAAVHCVIIGFRSAKAYNSALPTFQGGKSQIQKFAGGLQAPIFAEPSTRFLPRNKAIKPFSRELRRNSTKHENHLWYDFLCKFKTRFTRQRIIGNYIPDFFCYKAALVVELDGSQHYEPAAMEYDRIRTEYLNSLGIEVLRFPNREVDENFKAVCAKIAAVVEARCKNADTRCLQPPADFDDDFSPLKGGHDAEINAFADVDAPCIYDGEEKIAAKNINPYLIDAPNIFIESRSKPLCEVPEMITGNRPADGGHLIIEDADLEAFIKADPLSKKHIRRFMGAEEFINNKKRWCLWLVGVPASDLRKMPEVMKRIAACKKDRENAPDAGRRKLAETPSLFRETNHPENYILIPRVSSEKRSYIPISFLTSETIVSDSVHIIPNSTIYHFGILTSSVHMAWTRAVCGRLEMR
ncbi:MAG: DUF559 domain-containing protein, partial [Fibromonadaceae bacterium]|nr:DUF559 domain-containing protein [Fibromonadaceae bacterium]